MIYYMKKKNVFMMEMRSNMEHNITELNNFQNQFNNAIPPYIHVLRDATLLYLYF